MAASIGRGSAERNTPAQQASTKSISLFYLSVWKNEASAQAFAHLYADELGRKYSGIKPDKTTSSSSGESDGTVEQVYNSDEGPVVITRQGKMVFVSESFDLPLARKLAAFILGSQGGPAAVCIHRAAMRSTRRAWRPDTFVRTRP